MSNSMTQVDGLVYIGIDVGANGFSHPAVAMKQGYFFGWAGSTTRSSTLVEALQWTNYVMEELLTLAAAATSDTAANLLPANSLIHAVLSRVTVTTTTTATFTVGDATQAARFATGVAIAAGTTSIGFLHWNPAVASDNLGPRQTADAKIRVTPNATPGNALGRIALQSFVETFIAATA